MVPIIEIQQPWLLYFDNLFKMINLIMRHWLQMVVATRLLLAISSLAHLELSVGSVWKASFTRVPWSFTGDAYTSHGAVNMRQCASQCVKMEECNGFGFDATADEVKKKCRMTKVLLGFLQ